MGKLHLYPCHRHTNQNRKGQISLFKIDWKFIVWEQMGYKSQEAPQGTSPGWADTSKSWQTWREFAPSVIAAWHTLRVSHTTKFNLLLYIALTDSVSRSRPCFIYFPARATERLLLTSAGPQEVSFLMDRGGKTKCFQTWWS